MFQKVIKRRGSNVAVYEINHEYVLWQSTKLEVYITVVTILQYNCILPRNLKNHIFEIVLGSKLYYVG